MNCARKWEKFRFLIKWSEQLTNGMHIGNDRSEMAADLKRDFSAGGGKCHFFISRLERKSSSHFQTENK